MIATKQPLASLCRYLISRYSKYKITLFAINETLLDFVDPR